MITRAVKLAARRISVFPALQLVPPTKMEPNCDNAKRCEAALGIWRSSAPAGGTLVPASGEHRVVASENEGAS